MTKIQNGLENRLMNRLTNFIEKRQFSHENDNNLVSNCLQRHFQSLVRTIFYTLHLTTSLCFHLQLHAYHLHQLGSDQNASISYQNA